MQVNSYNRRRRIYVLWSVEPHNYGDLLHELCINHNLKMAVFITSIDLYIKNFDCSGFAGHDPNVVFLERVAATWVEIFNRGPAVLAS